MKILFVLLFLNISCQTTLEIEDKKLELAGQSGEANKKKQNIDWELIFESSNRNSPKVEATDYKVLPPEDEVKLSESSKFSKLLNEANEYIYNHNPDYAFGLLAQMKDEINSQEYPSKTDIFVYEHTLARAYLLNESFDQARKILIKLTKNDPTFIPGFILLADTYLEKGHPKAAEFIIKRGLQNN